MIAKLLWNWLFGWLSIAAGGVAWTVVLGSAAAVLALGPAVAAPASQDTQDNGAALYNAHCAACHDHAAGRAPSRDVLSRNPPAFIYEALKGGVMAPMAAGLSPQQMAAIAFYVSATKTLGDIDPHLIWGAASASSPLDGPRCPDPPAPIDWAAPQWNGWSPKPTNTRFQPRPGIEPGAVRRLKLKWAFNYPGSKNGQATIVGDRLYVTSMSGAIYALNARTGCVYWRHIAGAGVRSSVSVMKLPPGAPAKAALFFSDWTKSAVALDADTGRRLWKTKIDDSAGLQMTGSPTLFGRRLFVPISSGVEAFAASNAWPCCKFQGSVVALDALTGHILWKTHTTSVRLHVFKKNRLGKPMWGPSGGAVWSAPTVDAKRGLIYVGTSNSYTDLPYDGTDSIIAMDMATGAIRWKVQLLPGDDYIDGCYAARGRPLPANCPSQLGDDLEIGASPMLVKAPDGRDRIIVGQKSGVVYALDPDRRGRILWRTRLSPGGALGGVEFGMAADRDLVFVGISDLVSGPAGKPGLYALRISNGAVAWSAPNPLHPVCRWTTWWCHGAISQPVSAIPGVVFAGAYDGHFRAYSAETGKVLWDYDTGSKPIGVLGGRMAWGGVMDGAGPTIAGGMVYVHSGYAGRSSASGQEDLRGKGGNVLLAFSIDGR
ncbi:MAG: PQQ-binding-like beta-propeller repeat protein [Caulobacteraceae bacterium]